MQTRNIGWKAKHACMHGEKARDLLRGLYGLFESRVDVPRIRHGGRQTVETLINEEALLLAKFLRER